MCNLFEINFEMYLCRMSYEYETTCAECYRYTIPSCPTDAFELPTGLMAGTDASWRITDKFGNIWKGSSIIDADGLISIPVDAFEDGTFNPYAGIFKFEITMIGEEGSVICDGIDVSICGRDYACIAFDVANITQVESTPSGGGYGEE